ncbi:PREDICTED: uncharacterized protein LOC105976827 [Erythranthe guttata]|uniref:uncharacterized protein LOC105976827 n=1 Tax=Erythranthe guttata TaxID=4155 RepID=UPI00064DF877|nr:PREDICTED: uncharacterized protein LOC105976827 [Erythranthe guttata]|eukprot:XP_012857540.1 PREDICTED: uncharacterized protein LOC105976827 [Erythranthe guttata]
MAARTRSPVEDPVSSFFHHPSDGPVLVLVSQPLQNDNYSTWSRAMLLALEVKNKLGFVDGSIITPSRDDILLFNAWSRSNKVVISWILNAVSKEIQSSILYSDNAKSIWDDLFSRFRQTNGPRIFQLRREIAGLRQHTNSVNTYFTRLKALWDEVSSFRPRCTCGACTCGGVARLDDYYALEYTMTFLMGLHDSLQSSRVKFSSWIRFPLLAEFSPSFTKKNVIVASLI